MVKLVAVSLLFATSVLAAPSASASWKGWKTMKNLFVFGDSYSQTGFDPNGTQPSASNPFGNPTYPGWTSSNGPNWVGFLTTTYNASRLQTYNLAYGGATVDSALVTPYASTVLSLKNQVKDEFLPIYGAHPSIAPWKSADSLFAFFIGINDVGNTWWLNNGTLYDQIFSVYSGLLSDVYATGARNFLFLSVPPINLAPLTLSTDDGGYAVQEEGKVVLDWNAILRNMTTRFAASHSGTKIFVEDTWTVFNNVIKNPASYPQTSGLKNVTGYCAAYANGTPTWYTKDPNCTYSVNQYLWLNELHPTFPVHNATAASIAKLLNAS
ncbi:carbohydrate esterase family 16 protein [Dothidotthia symphoricarpi CBS 119687]|uniref:Carbohydrate esterase family 16 protein n=1 Tax=Dothidotthia symphoricarpi CBS 119687 TaxID=1392245 RepID=A0A6A6AEH6_9PLEO|nr:carbohydrate esterase family 16 protein [Dothidotthia symphoricarpi CBS 119687]KAF2130279.1 carbohydrate esterase family 16 protein [Dothidotthia symphoricarpi CBS 119687]